MEYQWGWGGGSQSTRLGNSAVSTANNTTALGFMANNGTSGANNTAVGTNALRNAGTTSNSVAIGEAAGSGSGSTVASGNTFIGHSANGPSNLSNATALGANATVTASNTIQLGNTAITEVNTSGGITMGGSLIGTNATAGATAATSTISGFAANINAQSADYTLTADDNSKIITFNSPTAIVLEVPTLFPGFNCLVIQLGAGQVTLTSADPGPISISNRNSYIRTAGQHAILTLVAITNNQFISSGDMTN